MTRLEFQRAFNALTPGETLACRECGLLSRAGCPHTVVDFVPAPRAGHAGGVWIIPMGEYSK